jgi:hypothetical protein
MRLRLRKSREAALDDRLDRVVQAGEMSSTDVRARHGESTVESHWKEELLGVR